MSITSSTGRPQNRHMVTSHAAPVPPMTVPAPTKSTSSAVFRRYSGSTVAIRCRHTSESGSSRLTSTARIGSATNPAARNAKTVSQGLPGFGPRNARTPAAKAARNGCGAGAAGAVIRKLIIARN